MLRLPLMTTVGLVALTLSGACGSEGRALSGQPADDEGDEATSAPAGDETGVDESTEDESTESESTGDEPPPPDLPPPDPCETYFDPGPLAAEAGQPVYHFEDLAHDGEVHNLCELIGKRFMLDLSAAWCGPCQMTADCIGGNNASCGQLFPGGLTPEIETLVTNIRQNLDEGKVHWVDIYYQTGAGGPTALADLEAWHAAYYTERESIWVMTDQANITNQFLPAQGIPFFVSVDEDFRYLNVNNGYEWTDLAN